MTYRAVFFDFGGVIISSPFVDLNRYEEEHGIPRDFIRQVNSQSPNDNAWARMERNEITVGEFDRQFASESEAMGHRIPGGDLIPLLEGEIRPVMVGVVATVKAAGYIVACLTNSVGADRRGEVIAAKSHFDHVIDSSVVGTRKPEPDFYARSCEVIGVEPSEAVFLDDLGINLKPARKLGMTTIKVFSEEQAIADLEETLGLSLKDNS